jgi:hypothetical protein
MRNDVVYRLSCCGHSITVCGTPNGDEAVAEKEAVRCLRRLCKCNRASSCLEKREVQPVLYGHCLAPPKVIPLVNKLSEVR